MEKSGIYYDLMRMNVYLSSIFKLVFGIGTIIPLSMAFVACGSLTDTTSTDPEKNPSGAEYYSDTHLRYQDYVYRDDIRTVIFHKKGWELGAPYFALNTDEGVSLTFDDLGADQKQYYYKLVHCTSGWEPSDLMDQEYLEGYFTNSIRDYRQSINTLVPYTQYRLTVPNEDLKVTKSGNYLLMVFQDNDEDQVVLTRRFMVYESKVTVQGNIRFPSNLNKRATGQELDFTIQHGAFPMASPQSDLHVVLLQNNRWDNAITGLMPIFIKDQSLTYDYNTDENLFWGGNEFRNFDLKSLRYRNEEVRRIDRSDSIYAAILAPDEVRARDPYYNHPDINGRFIIRNNDGFDHQLESDYFWIHFQLPYSAPLEDGAMYIYGGLTDWRFQKRFRLAYNYEHFAYEGKILLKQGYYNYHYMRVKDNNKAGDLSLTEGNHFETENDYTVLVYYRSITDDYDRLIGVEFLNSRRNP